MDPFEEFELDWMFDSWLLYVDTGFDSMFIRFWVRVFDIAVTGIGDENDDDGIQEVTWDDEVVVTVDSWVVGDDTVVVEAGVEPRIADWIDRLLPVVECDEGLADAMRSIPGTIAAGTGGGAGSGDVGSRVGRRGARISGNLLYKFSRGDRIFISRSFWRNVSTHSCIISLFWKTCVD